LIMAPDQWAQERGAITQEVTQDNSDAIYRLFVKMEARLVGGTPYNKNGLGTVEGFKNDVNSAQLLKFYHSWYHPNNAVYVIVGNVDGAQTIARVKQLFGNIPSAKLPARDAVHLQPLHGATYHETSDQPYTAVLLGYRMPGYDSPDYAAAQILGDVLNNQRSTFGALPFTGKALGIEFDEQTFTKAGIGIAFAAVPVTSKPQDVDAEIRGIINDYRSREVARGFGAGVQREFDRGSGRRVEPSRRGPRSRFAGRHDFALQERERRGRESRSSYLLEQHDRGGGLRRSEECRRRQRRRSDGRRK
jgi:zinc protease